MAVEQQEPMATGYVGSSQRKHDGEKFLTGRVTYTNDVQVTGTLHVAVLRSPHAHARILGVDAEAALADPAVVDVLTGAQAAELADPIPHNLDPAGLGGNHADIRCLAHEKVVYAGQPVVAVVALTPGDAFEAAAAVQVEYEVLPPVLDVEAALADGASRVYEEWPSNVMISGLTGEGDFEEAAAAADHTLSDEIHLQRSTTAPMEPRAYLADWDERAQLLTWYGTTQNPHPQRWVLANALRLSERQIRVIAPTPGGAFGLKMHGHPEEVLVGVLACKLGRPVKWAETRAECMLAAGKEQVHRFRVAYDDDGRVRGLHSVMHADHGAAAAGPGWGMAFVGSLGFPSGYDIPICVVEYTVVVTNKPPWAGARPFGKESTALVMERIMDRVAEATGLDPLEVRRRNWVRSDQFPYKTAAGLELDSGDYHGLADLVLERVDYDALRAEQVQARAEGRLLGVGLGFEMLPEGADIPGALVGGFDTVTVRMDPSGEVTVLTGVTSPGSGNDTGIAQIVADRVGVSMDVVTVVQGDTATCPYGFGNLSSRGIVAGGGAAVLAADDVAAKLRSVAAAMFHAEADDIVLSQGMASVASEPAKAAPIFVVAKNTYSLGYILGLGIEPTLESTRTYKPPNIRHLPDDHGHISVFATFASALHLSVVEVDPETGETELLRHVAVHDCGTQINPMFVKGQFQGGIVMGLGVALHEELLHDDEGRLVTDSFKTYLLPRANDLPTLELGHQVTPSPFTPMGAKGAGESGFAGAVAAVLNAVNDAISPRGVHMDTMPLSAPAVLARLGEAQ